MIRVGVRAALSCVLLGALMCAFACRTAPVVAFNTLELLFGLSRPDGTFVSESEWQRFEQDVLVAELDGYTVLRADGAWLDPATQAVVREPSRAVIHYFDPPRYAEVRRSAERIVDAYKLRFEQQSVLIGFGCGAHEFR